ncbi:MAG: Transcription regulator, AsnC-type [Gammaproteobacteria bacterium]|nr:Transcription regulator, AsnC-type [Gammaproteobacteria bacterium]
MVKAVVLINVRSDLTNRASQSLAETPGVVEVYSVAGNYDLVAVLAVPSNEALADLVTEKIRSVAGVTRTETLIAFRSYSGKEVEGLLTMD